MKISIILGHPYKKSFNHAVAQAVADTLKVNGHEVFWHDLHEEGFNPVMLSNELVNDSSEDPLITAHQEEIKMVDGIVIVHPNWWGQPPAILKGWVDRVLRQEIAYTFPENDNGGGLPIGLLKAKVGIVFNTSNTPAQREDEVFSDPLQRIWKDCIFGFCGVHTFDRRMFRIVADSTPVERQQWLEETKSLIHSYFPRS